MFMTMGDVSSSGVRLSEGMVSLCSEEGRVHSVSVNQSSAFLAIRRSRLIKRANFCIGFEMGSFV